MPNKYRYTPDDEFRMEGWPRGLNTLVSATKIRDDELTAAENIELVETGIPTKRRGRAYFGDDADSRLWGLTYLQKSDGTHKLIRKSDTTLSTYNTATTGWDDISGNTYTDSYPVNFVQSQNKIYAASEVDDLSYYDGSVLTVFNSAAQPTALAVSAVGGTGTSTYSFRLSSVTNVGETAAVASVTAGGLPETLSNTAYPHITWNSATQSSIIGYNVFGRKSGKEMWLHFVDGASAQAWDDHGSETPSTIFGVPISDTTTGPKGEIICLYKDTLFISGDPTAPSRLYYSAGGDKINSFSIEDGGGFIDIQRDDGDEITGLIVFQDKLIVFKKRSIHQFTFTTSGLPQVSVINQAVGAVAFRSIVAVENDVFFLSERGVFVLGNEPNYYNVIRTNELTARIRPKMLAVNKAKQQYAAATYFEGLYILSVADGSSTTNNKTYVYDRERLAWYEWDFGVNCWLVYYDATGVDHILYGSETDGYVVELTGEDDFGSAFTAKIKTKQMALKQFERYKRWKNLVFHFRNVSGSVSVTIWTDGISQAKTFSINRAGGYVGWGYDRWANFLWGSTAGTSADVSQIDIVRRLRRVQGDSRSIAFEVKHQVSGNFNLLGIFGAARPRSKNYYPAEEVIAD